MPAAKFVRSASSRCRRSPHVKIRFPLASFPVVVDDVIAATVTTPPASAAPSRTRMIAYAAVIVVAGLLAYSRTFSAPFVFDDQAAIIGNPTIRHLWPLTEVL